MGHHRQSGLSPGSTSSVSSVDSSSLLGLPDGREFELSVPDFSWPGSVSLSTS